MRSPVFTGSGVALVTPFRDGQINFDVLGKLIEYHIEHDTDAIIICGTTGEAPTQNVPEHLEAIDFTVKKANGRIKVLAGTGSNDTFHAVQMCAAAEKSGADGLLMVTPYYNKTTQRGLVKHYNYIADRVNIPSVLYTVPSRTGLSFTAQSYAELAKHPNINGVKEASGNLSLVAQTRYLCPDDFYIWSGNDDQVVPIMAMGGKDIISVAANIVPDIMVQMSHACLEGDFKTGERLQIQYYDLIEKLFIETNPIPIKEAMNLLGMDVGPVRMPLCEMAEENKAKLIDAMKKVGLL